MEGVKTQTEKHLSDDQKSFR